MNYEKQYFSYSTGMKNYSNSLKKISATRNLSQFLENAGYLYSKIEN